MTASPGLQGETAIRVEPNVVDGRPWGKEPRHAASDVFVPFASAADAERWWRAGRMGPRTCRAVSPPV